MERTQVVIAGAGPTGLALAYGLAQQGIRSIVVEQKEALSPHSRAPGVLPRTLEILRSWKLEDRFVAAGALLTEPKIWLAGADAEPLARLNLDALRRASPIPGLLILPQDKTEALLAEAVAETGLSEIRFNHRLAHCRQDEGKVVVDLQVESGGPVSIEADYLVGCDGAHSAVREELGWELEGFTYPSRVMLADVRITGERDKMPWPRVAAEGNRPLAALRIEPTLWRIIGVVGKDDSDDDATSPEAIRQKTETLFGSGPEETVWASVFRIHCRTSPHFRAGRILLAGDAAHINSPAGGQGMNSGIQDAHNLAWKLARALRGGDAAALLVSYEAERRPVIVHGVDRYTDFLTRYVLLAKPRRRTFFLKAVRQALGSSWLRRQMIQRVAMLGTVYHDSPLLTGDGAWTGHRAPDAPLTDADGRIVHLLDLAGPRAVLLLFEDRAHGSWDRAETSAAVAGVADLAIRRLVPRGVTPVGEELCDHTGRLWQSWRPSPRQAALVRPDGHVGWMAAGPSPYALRIGCSTALGALPTEGEAAAMRVRDAEIGYAEI